MKIINAEVYDEKGGFQKREVYTDGPWIATESGDQEVLDGEGCYLIPGLTDIHFHGCMGQDLCDGTVEAIEKIAEYEASQGVTTIIPATMTLSEEQLTEICKTFASCAERLGLSEKGSTSAKDGFAAAEDKNSAILAGIHMEGPFVSEKRLGAQNPAFVQKMDVDLFRALNKASGGRVKFLTFAPELEGAEEAIQELKDEVVLSVGHTEADYQQASEAFARGVHHVTHLYNAMSGLSHRAPGVVGAAADRENVEVELICDGIHIHPVTVRQTFKMFGDERIILISDSMEATGMPDGSYLLGGQKVLKRGKRASLEDGTLAGSVTNLMDCLRVLVREMQIPLESAVKCAAVNPAKSAEIYDQFGSITVGKMANLVLLRKEDLGTEQVILKGRTLND